MSIGKQPSVSSLNLQPLSADPTSPREGDMYWSDGTARNEGPWIYQNAAWAAISTGAAITVVDNQTLTPQAADPGSPTTGMLFYADGTSRAAGLWGYNGTGWVQITGVRYQEFYHKDRFTVRSASTANVTLANQVENGDSFGGVTLATGDLVLLKNQSTASENGVYVVAASGPPARSTSYDTFTELNNAQIYVSSGTNTTITYWQTATLTSLSDNQTWGTTPPTFSFTVPNGVYEVDTIGLGAGGAGGHGGSSGATYGGGGGGGAGTILQKAPRLPVTPGEVLTIGIGVALFHAHGTASTVTGFDGAIPGVYFPGGSRGGSGSVSQVAGTGASTYAATVLDMVSTPCPGGSGGGGSAGEAAPTVNLTMGGTIVGAAGGADGQTGAGGGGGGSSSFGAGGIGGAGNPVAGSTPGQPGLSPSASKYGAGGGGGGGGGNQGEGKGGLGIGGYVKISW